MKINEVEQALGITKANIRFYEKEGLLSPGRTEKGYREYSEADLDRLKEIIIFRKLGIPVQQIADILDGAVHLQAALDENIRQLNEEIEKLNGSLALCQQLKSENADFLDMPRYWDILQKKEDAGFRFQSLVSDYISFLAPTLSWAYGIPEDAWYSPKKVLMGLAIWSAAYTLLWGSAGGSLIGTFLRWLTRFLLGVLIYAALFLPVYRLSKTKPELAKTLEVLIPVGLMLAVLGYFIWSMVSVFPA